MTIFGPKKAKNTIGAPSIPVYDQFFSICMAKSELKKQELEGSGKGALYDPIFVFREPPITGVTLGETIKCIKNEEL